MKFQYWFIGAVALGLGGCGGAETASKNASSPEVVSGTVEDGEAMIERSDFAGAEALFRGLAERSPSDPKVFYYLGLSERNLGNFAAAVSAYEKSLALAPDLMDARINLGLTLLDLGQLDRAEKELKVYLDASPDDADAQFNYGLVQESMGHLDEAQSHYEKAAMLDPEDPSPLFGLGDVARARGKREKALSYYTDAEKLNGEMPDLVYVKGETQLEMKRVAEACKTFKNLLLMTQPDLAIVVEAGKRIADTDSTCAADLYQGAVEKDDTFASAHFYLANSLARDKKFTEAAAHFEQFLALAPNDPAAPEAKKRLEACRNMP